MEIQGQSRGGRTATASTTFAVFAVMCLALGATVIYYNSVPSRQGTNSNSTTATTTSIVTKTSTATTTSTATVLATSTTPADGTALAIYNNDSKSVVTIVGVVATTVNNWPFGTYTSYSEVEGSGFVTDYNGSPYIITNYHVVEGTSNRTVTFSNGDAYLGNVVGSDVYADLAVISISAPASEFVPLTIVESSGLQVGESVYVIGAPYGLTGTFTSGLISQLGRTIQEATTGQYSISGIIQFTAPINPGNSGGPLLDSKGEVIGITTATISGSTGLGFATPSQTIIRELPSLINPPHTYTSHSYLGISGEDMNYQLAQASKTNITYGVLLEQVTSGGPASKAGLMAGTTEVTISGTQYLIGGDIIISANGTRLINMDALSSYLEQNTVAGQTVVLGIVRAGVMTSVTVTLGARPQP
ncbi:MAG: trypsin-like peptidase domain-containing protein [Nitrososphaerales archaeon]